MDLSTGYIADSKAPGTALSKQRNKAAEASRNAGPLRDVMTFNQQVDKQQVGTTSMQDEQLNESKDKSMAHSARSS
jgi:hypothetical protein